MFLNFCVKNAFLLEHRFISGNKTRDQSLEAHSKKHFIASIFQVFCANLDQRLEFVYPHAGRIVSSIVGIL